MCLQVRQLVSSLWIQCERARFGANRTIQAHGPITGRWALPIRAGAITTSHIRRTAGTEVMVAATVVMAAATVGMAAAMAGIEPLVPARGVRGSGDKKLRLPRHSRTDVRRNQFAMTDAKRNRVGCNHRRRVAHVMGSNTPAEIGAPSTL